jgi:hypothetical protein
VREGEFMYFLYQENCKDCSILISLSSHSGGSTTEVYIKKGMTLPTKESYDMKRSGGDVIALSKNDSPMLKDVASMADIYVIAVYGKKNTTF